MPTLFPDRDDVLLTPERLKAGYVVVLPGIEGRSHWNQRLIKGLVDGGVSYGIERHDWTIGRFRFLHNLRSTRRHQVQSSYIAHKIVKYRQQYGDRPVYLIGHSGGGAMSLLTLKKLPENVKATGAILLANAMSPQFDVAPALQKTERGIWNFSSLLDLFFLAFGTVTCGTVDGRHSLSAGLVGFHQARTGEQNGQPQLIECPYQLKYALGYNFAGHFGCTARPFVKRYVAPLLLE